MLGFGAAGFLLLGGLFAWLLGKKISSSVVALVAPSRSLLAGEPVIAPSVFFREAEDVATALFKGAELLVQRTTERELASKELGKAEEANLERTRFMSTISHELRSPLHTILGNLSLLRKAHSESLDPFLKVAEKGGVQLLKLIDELLDFNIDGLRPDALQLDWTELSYLRTMLLHFGTTAASMADNRFAIDIAANVPLRLMVDERRLLQVLKNLVGNACKYTKSGQVSLRIECLTSTVDRGDPSRQTVRFSVQDTGRGIEPHDLQRIFEPLYRSASATDQAGVGLGLSIARQWVRNMGGDIVVTSEAGRGSIFQFDLLLKGDEVSNGNDGFELSTILEPKVQHTSALPVPPFSELQHIEELVNMGRMLRLADCARALALDARYTATAHRVIELAEAADLPALKSLLAQWKRQSKLASVKPE
jgi:signal transduction histidine kinase